MTQEEQVIMLTEHEGEIHRHEGRIKKLEERQDKLDQMTAAMATISTKQETMENDISEIKTDVKSLTDKPGKKWENLVETVLKLLVAALVGFALAKIGL